MVQDIGIFSGQKGNLTKKYTQSPTFCSLWESRWDNGAETWEDSGMFLYWSTPVHSCGKSQQYHIARDRFVLLAERRSKKFANFFLSENLEVIFSHDLTSVHRVLPILPYRILQIRCWRRDLPLTLATFGSISKFRHSLFLSTWTLKTGEKKAIKPWHSCSSCDGCSTSYSSCHQCLVSTLWLRCTVKLQIFVRYPFSYFWLETGSYELIFVLSRASKQNYIEIRWPQDKNKFSSGIKFRTFSKVRKVRN